MARRRHEPASERPIAATGQLERLIFLSDGVFAIALTLLVVSLEVPAGSSDLAAALWQLRPKFLSYGVSFLAIAAFWISHQRVFRYIVRIDGRLVWISLIFLLCIGFQPFPTAVLGSSGDQPIAVTLYAGTLMMTSLLVLAMWVYSAVGHRLVQPDLSHRFIRYQTVRAVVAPVVFAISIVIAQFNTSLAELSWLSIAILLSVVHVLMWDSNTQP
jgi:uncharacterized membrane protein